MNCEACCDLLLDYVEGAVEPSAIPAMEAHFRECESCRAALEQTRALVGAMQDIRVREEQASAASRSRKGPTLAGLVAWGAGARLGDFEILGELGRGGMGIVYRARQISLNRLVALKVLPGVFRETPGAVARFQKEAQAAAKLHHTNIVPVYAQGEQDGHFYYAMELVEGDSLDHILREDPARIVQQLTSHSLRSTQSQLGHTEISRRQGFQNVARLIAGVAEGLHHAHTQGVVHRDIKPQNLLLAPEGQLRITDFGLARLLDEPSITLTGEMVGTPAYMSPEQIRGKRETIDRRTDIYSLGVTFYEVLTGKRPFEGMSRDEVVMRILQREPKPPRRLNPAIPLDLETICLRAMEKEPQRRYATAADMATDLRRYADDQPIFSRRAGQIEKALKWVRRHPAMSTIYALLVVISIGAATWRVQTLRSRQARADELVRQAFAAMVFEDYREPEPALARLAEAARLSPTQWDYRRAMGLATLHTDPRQAVEELQWVTAQRPNDADSLYLLAWAQRLHADRVDAAVRATLMRAETLGGPTTAEGHFFKGMVLIREMDEAEKEFRRAVEMRSNYTQAILHLGRSLNHWMYHNRRHDKFAEQERHLKNACDLQPKQAYPRYLLSIAYRLSAEIYLESRDENAAEPRFAEALRYAREAQAVEPDSARGYVAEAEYWETRRDYAKALRYRDLSEPYCDKPESIAELHQYRWRLHFWLSHHEAAINDLERLAALRDDSDPKRAWYMGLFPALVMADQGNVALARERVLATAREKPTSFRAILAAASFLRMSSRSEEANELLEQYRDQVVFEPSGRSEVSYGFMRACFRPLNIQHFTEKATSYLSTVSELRGGRALIAYLKGMSSLREKDRSNAYRLLSNCDAAYDSEDYCYLARVMVRKLEMDPAWPAWNR